MQPRQCSLDSTALLAKVPGVDPALRIDELGGLGLVPEVAHAGVPAPGDDLPQPAVLVGVLHLDLPAVVALAHAAQLGAWPGGGGSLRPGGLAGPQQLLQEGQL